MEIALAETWQCGVAVVPLSGVCAFHVMQSLLCLSTLCFLLCLIWKRFSCWPNISLTVSTDGRVIEKVMLIGC